MNNPLSLTCPTHVSNAGRAIPRASQRTTELAELPSKSWTLPTNSAVGGLGGGGRQRDSRAAAAAAAFRSSRAAAVLSLSTSGGSTGLSCATLRTGRESSSESAASAAPSLLQGQLVAHHRCDGGGRGGNGEGRGTPMSDARRAMSLRAKRSNTEQAESRAARTHARTHT